jgi:DivIVA domain-containing protein
LALDRQTIEKRDFPIGRRGYEPEAVDAHLARLADQIDEIQRSSGQTSRASLAATASAQVQAIVEAAETSAASIESEARDDAARIRKEANQEADQTRDQAVSESQDHVGKVREATTHMLSRVDAMEGELGALIESLRTGANRLSADLALLEGNMGDLFTAAGQSPGASAAPVAAVPEPEPEPREEGGRRATGAKPTPVEPEEAATASAVAQGGDEEPGDEVPESYEGNGDASAAVEAEPEPEPVEEAVPAGGGESDVEGARLVALNMALNGQTRDETDRYLAENFQLSDRDALLDEVYATVE